MFLSKLCKVSPALRDAVSKRRLPGLLARVQRPVLRSPSRDMTSIMPLNQYENNYCPNKFRLGYVLFHHWEVIPLFLVVVVDGIILCGAIYMSLMHRVDTQLTGHDWNCISRTMDLRHPTIHKNLTFYERYDPWPEMQDVFDKMRAAEHRLHTRANLCQQL